MKIITHFCLLIATFTYVTTADNNSSSCPTIVTKQEWGATPATNVSYQILPVPNVIIHHTVTQKCTSILTCSRILLAIQNYHVQEMNYDDIAYNFLIGNDGRVYEGVGWHIEGAHTYGYNKKSIGIAFIGDFYTQLPTAEAIDAAKNLIKCGVELGELDVNYQLLGAKQINLTGSPGLVLYREIQNWDHWSSL